MPAPTADVIRLRDVSVIRQRSRLLDGIDWDVEEGDRWVVLGATAT